MPKLKKFEITKSTNNENVKWEDNKCTCTTEGQTWDNEQHKCVDDTPAAEPTNIKDDVECTADRNNKKIIFQNLGMYLIAQTVYGNHQMMAFFHV